MTPEADIFVFSNGHGEDEIGGLVLDRLARTDAERARIAAWPMVGDGARYIRTGVATFGPRNDLPSEGFGTMSLPAFLRDLRSGFVGTYLSQIRFARSLRGKPKAILAIGDVVPLAAATLAGGPALFFSSAKSAHYGGTDGHNPLERALMRRAARVLVRDARTARQLGVNGVAARFIGNPMMDGVAGGEGSAFRAEGRRVLALIPGTRADAPANARLLLDAAARLNTVLCLLPAHDGFDLAALESVPPPGWRVSAAEEGALALSHDGGAEAIVAKGRFADMLAASEIAVGMAGTGNEQAVGLGLPLIAVPGSGNQGAAFHAMKRRYFGAAAIDARPDPSAIAGATRRLAEDPRKRAAMGEAGRALMGAPGAAAAIANELRALAGWERIDG
ncbi:MAG: lipid-A-disaccharide synthase-related protein [Paracoccaceae bacterium]|nr:lipid-A-disaccharide synthase-related protein [Paracoccaceae bacterium]